jgi:putative membrane protein
MKNKRLLGFIVAASLAVGTTATFAQQNQPSDQSSQPAQDQPSPAQDQQSGQSQIQSGAQAQPSTELNEPAGAATGSFDKQKFIKDTAEGNMAELNIAQVATQKAQDPAVKDYAQKLVTDHSKMGDQVKEIAQKEGITLSSEVDSKHQKMIDHLSGLSGAEFDKAFAMHMVKDHKKDIDMFKKAAASDDSQISEFAKNTLPTLQEHLRTAQQWAPDTAAGAAVEEPSGAEKKSDDANKSDQLNQDKQQNQDLNKDQNQSQSPDNAGQAAPK